MNFYQLHMDRLPVAPRRCSIIDAAMDAIELGCATPERGTNRIVLDDCAEIVKCGAPPHLCN